MRQNDVSSPRELQLMAVKVEKELGPVEILVNNASLMPMTSTPHLKSDEIDTILQLNLGSYIMVWNRSLLLYFFNVCIYLFICLFIELFICF